MKMSSGTKCLFVAIAIILVALLCYLLWASTGRDQVAGDFKAGNSRTADSENGLIFTGYDPILGDYVKIEKSEGVYMMDGMTMEVRRHPNILDRGVSLAIVDRVGEPNMYYVLHQGELSIYIDCEFGPCRYKRSIQNK